MAMKKKKKYIKLTPKNVLKEMETALKHLLEPISQLRFQRKILFDLQAAGIKCIGDLIQIPEEILASDFNFTLEERECLRKYLGDLNLIWEENISDFVKYLFACAKAYRGVDLEDDNLQTMSLLIVLFKKPKGAIAAASLKIMLPFEMKNWNQEMKRVAAYISNICQ